MLDSTSRSYSTTTCPAPKASQVWLQLGLGLARLQGPLNDQASPWLLALLGEIPTLPPPGVVLDIGRIVTGGSLTPKPCEHTAIRRYEDHFLGRILQDRRLQSITDAMAGIRFDQRATAIGMLVGAILTRIKFMGVEINPGLVRAIDKAPSTDETERVEAAMGSLLKAYEVLAKAGETYPALLADSDVFMLEHMDVFRSFGQRVAVTQTLAAAEWLESQIPRSLRSKRKADGSTQTSIEDESSYPVGGFASISTQGTFENLVPSELIYMERTTGGSSPRSGEKPSVDIFTLRWAEGELLYYTRDESVFVRPKRHFVFVLDEPLVSARVKVNGAQWQKVILALASLVVIVRQLVKRLTIEDLTIEIAVHHALDRERALLELLVHDWPNTVAVTEYVTKETFAETDLVSLHDTLPSDDWATWVQGVVEGLI